MTTKYFKYVLFNSKTGSILNEVTPSEDSLLMDINNTGTIELDIPFHSLTNANRKDIGKFFDPINRGLALLRLNELGETIGCVDAGLIVKREFNVEEQNAHIQTTGFAGYLAKIGAKWVTTPITTKPAPTVSYSGTPAQIYQSILNGALINSDGISTIQNWDTDFGSSDTRSETFTFPLTDFYTAQDAIEEVRDEIFEGKAAEIRWVPVLQISDNKIKWVARTSNNSNSLINAGLDPLELPLKSWEPNVREVSSYEINEDAQDIYNYLVIDASEGSGDNETVFIKAKNETASGGLTVFQSFDTGVDLTDSQMDSQLASRLKNSNVPEKSGTITLIGTALSLENIPYSYEVSGSMHFVNYGTLGRRIKGIAGTKATGLGSTLRCTEITFSIREWDTSLTLTLQTVMNVYPSLPSQRKLEKKENKKRTSSKKQDRDSSARKKKKKSTKGGNDDTSGSDFEWDGTDSGDPTDGVGGRDTEDKPDLKPDVLDKSEPSDYTIGSYQKQLTGISEYFSPVFNFKGYNYIFSYSYNSRNILSPIDIENPVASYTAETTGEILLNMINVPADENDTGDILEKSNVNYSIKMKSFQGLRDLAPERFPNTVFTDYVSLNPSIYIEDYKEIDNLWGAADSPMRTGFYCFVMNGKFYGHYFAISSMAEPVAGYWLYESDFHGMLGEVFFTAEIDEINLTLKNYELLTSPAEQLYGTDGTNFCISLNNLATSLMNTETRSNDSQYSWDRYTNLFSKGVYLNNSTPYFDFSSNWKECVFFNTGFFSGAKGMVVGNYEQGGITSSPAFFSPNRSNDIGITNEMLNVDFGLLEADFTNKQPVFKESKIGLPVPKKKKWAKVINVMDNGYVVFGSSSDGDFTYAPTRGFKYVTSINGNGVAISFKFNLDKDKFNELWDGENYNEFQAKYTNRVWSINKDKKWKEVKLDTNYNLNNQDFTPCIIMPDGELLTSLKSENGVVKARTAGKYNKVEGAISMPYDITTQPMTVAQDKNVTSNKKFSSINSIRTSSSSTYSTFIWNSKFSKYKEEVLQIPSNNSMSLLKTETDMLFNGKWYSTAGFAKDNLGSIFQISYGKKLDDFKAINTRYSNPQKRIDVALDFKEFASFSGCNMGVDSNGDLWQWGIKLTTNVGRTASDQDAFLNNNVAFEAGINWEPVKISLPFKVKKFDFTGSVGTYGSEFKALVMLSDEGKVYTLGFINANQQLSTTWKDVSEVPSTVGKVTDVKFRRNGLTLISENLDLCYSGINPDGGSSESITDIQKIDNPSWNGKVKNIRSMPSRNSSSDGVKAVFTTTDGSAYGMGTKFTNQAGQKIPYDGKVVNIYYNNSSSDLDMILLIDDKGKVVYVNRSSTSTTKFDMETWTDFNGPEGFRAEEWIYLLNDTSTPTQSMLFGKYGSGLSESGAVISMDSFVNASAAWTPDAVGAMRADGFVWGSEIDTGSLLPSLDFLNDGEGGMGQDWSAGNWLTQTGDGVPPTPSGNEVITGEGELGDKTVVDGVSMPTEWLDESNRPEIEEPPVVP